VMIDARREGGRLSSHMLTVVKGELLISAIHASCTRWASSKTSVDGGLAPVVVSGDVWVAIVWFVVLVDGKSTSLCREER
jgi:hypothetical protein